MNIIIAVWMMVFYFVFAHLLLRLSFSRLMSSSATAASVGRHQRLVEDFDQLLGPSAEALGTRPDHYHSDGPPGRPSRCGIRPTERECVSGTRSLLTAGSCMWTCGGGWTRTRRRNVWSRRGRGSATRQQSAEDGTTSWLQHPFPWRSAFRDWIMGSRRGRRRTATAGCSRSRRRTSGRGLFGTRRTSVFVPRRPITGRPTSGMRTSASSGFFGKRSAILTSSTGRPKASPNNLRPRT
mmetsp:Transcript_7922/g.11198  ORF Transcript_7922/g.11198 Transcript_7922/m.11198 type:complete len:238 (+) Transcript_7922:366-1079(+)